ncbi:Complement component C1q receptor [Chelonia mydas]|uniref:Complement component C1q receptor n=1 Tax=Chelonia mydas TaxID=8469 RepID=M7B5D8_CHEMY|nr:Complement component C1q receptor [Chelonia mydas]
MMKPEADQATDGPKLLLYYILGSVVVILLLMAFALGLLIYRKRKAKKEKKKARSATDNYCWVLEQAEKKAVDNDYRSPHLYPKIQSGEGTLTTTLPSASHPTPYKSNSVLRLSSLSVAVVETQGDDDCAHVLQNGSQRRNSRSQSPQPPVTSVAWTGLEKDQTYRGIPEAN